jgi:hypothetical protein
MKLFRADSTTSNQNIEDNQNITEKKEVTIKQETLTNNAKEDDYNITGINV